MTKPGLILVRGVPGSGKSTLAKSIKDFTHVEADMFWGPGYGFDITRIKEAHDWCIEVTGNILSVGYSVVVSNTFTTLDEMKPYFILAKKHEIKPLVLHCQNNFGSIHDVPDDTILKMKDRFQFDVSPLFEEFFG